MHAPASLAGLPWELPHRFLGLDDEASDFSRAKALLLPVPYESTTSWGVGARGGPGAILESSRYIELYDQELGADPSTVGIHTLPALELSRAGASQAMAELGEAYQQVLDAAGSRFVVMFGGEHSVSSPAIRAWAARTRGRLTVLQLDAHADLRAAYEGSAHSHACAMARVLDVADVVAVGVRALSAEEVEVARTSAAVSLLWADDMWEDESWMDRAMERLGNDVYLTFDVDYFDPSLMPSTGTPEPGGGDWYRTLRFLRRVFRERNVVACDVVELAPIQGLHAPDFMVAKLVYKLLGYRFEGQLLSATEHRPGILLPDGDELGRAAPGALETFPAQAMERATGALRVEGNALRLQFEGSSTFEAWIEAILGARRFVYFENYILRDDHVGRAFRDALVSKALEGVPVWVVYDWVGCWATPRSYWRPLRQAGVQVRAFNRPSIRDPLGVLQRDHRKLVCVDGEVAFCGGFCVGIEWAGLGDDPPWRDTGVEVRGPAALVAARAFERVWAAIGSPLPEEITGELGHGGRAGITPVWIIEGEPGRSRMFRTLALIAAHARRRLWITDPYFVAPRPVSEALAAAARDGVDVRVLVPAHNNWPWVGSLSRSGYRFLLEAGVRLFEWQGSMMHAKTLVCDGVWSRVGSSNLNISSLISNWEIDVGVLDEDLAAQLEGLYLADLASSVEIVLPRAHWPGGVAGRTEAFDREPPKASLEPVGSVAQRLERELRGGPRGGSTGWRLADLVRAGSVFGSAIAGHRPLGREDRTLLGTVSAITLGAAVLFAIFPRIVGFVLAALLAWLGIVIGVRAFIEAREAKMEERGER